MMPERARNARGNGYYSSVPETGGRNINREDGREREFLRKKFGKNRKKGRKKRKRVVVALGLNQLISLVVFWGWNIRILGGKWILFLGLN